MDVQMDSEAGWQQSNRKKRRNSDPDSIASKSSRPGVTTPTKTRQESTHSILPPKMGVIPTRPNMYSSSHFGQASVMVIISKESLKETRSQNMMLIAKAVSNSKCGAQSLKPRGFNKAEVFFNNGQEANRMIESSALGKAGISAFIPRQRLEKKGLVKGIPLDLETEEIIEKADSPCRITYAKRLNRRVVDAQTQSINWIPSETVLLTFEAPVVPKNIKLYLLNFRVSPYVERVMTCKNCGRYGHTINKCRSPSICLACGEKTQGVQHECSKEDLNCLHCKARKQTFHSDCPTMILNREINNILAHSDCSIYEAIALAKEKMNNEQITETAVAKNANVYIKQDHPELPKISSSKEFHLRVIGGIQKQATSNANRWQDRTIITYGKDNKDEAQPKTPERDNRNKEQPAAGPGTVKPNVSNTSHPKTNNKMTLNLPYHTKKATQNPQTTAPVKSSRSTTNLSQTKNK